MIKKQLKNSSLYSKMIASKRKIIQEGCGD